MLNPDRNGKTPQIYVWHPFLRLFHWSLVVGFTIAYLIEDDLLKVHVWAGYVVGLPPSRARSASAPGLRGSSRG
jgi:hypothetical protein